MALVFGVNAIAAALYGSSVLAVAATVTGVSSLLTGAVLERSASRRSGPPLPPAAPVSGGL